MSDEHDAQDESAESVGVIAEDLFRREAAHLLSALTRLLGPQNLSLVEDVVQEALLTALSAWRFGVPAEPRAWILKTAKNKALDHIRRNKKLAALTPILESEWTLADTIEGALDPSEDAANQLAMMFSCCHEDLAEETRVTLIMRFLCGLGPHEIARAFLVDVQTVDRRIHRGREKLASKGRLQNITDEDEMRARLPAVLRALYLLFSEGYHGSDADFPVRAALCAEAMRLADLLLGSEITAGPEVHALLALFFFDAARLETRLDQKGEKPAFLPLAEQDRKKWNRALIDGGVIHLGLSATGNALTHWHLEAGIACEHSTAPSMADTNWERIVVLYDALFVLSPGPVIALNRALAIAELRGVKEGSAALSAIEKDPRLLRYPFYWAAVADLARRAGRTHDAKKAYKTAIELSNNHAERESYERRLRALSD